MGILNWHRWGEKGDGRVPILALHGFTGSGMDFECFVSGTVDYCAWWAPDLMGHGGSPVSEAVADYTVEAQMGYLDEIVEQIGEPFVLLGYSMGGRLALRYALERPERVAGMILVGASPGLMNEEERRVRQASDERLAESIVKDGVEVFLKEWQESPMIKSQKEIPSRWREGRMERRHRNNALGLANALRGMGAGVMEPLWGRLGEIECPVTLITGERDKKYCEIAEEMGKRLRKVKHVVIPGVGHAAIWEDGNYFTFRLLTEIVSDTNSTCFL